MFWLPRILVGRAAPLFGASGSCKSSVFSSGHSMRRQSMLSLSLRIFLICLLLCLFWLIWLTFFCFSSLLGGPSLSISYWASAVLTRCSPALLISRRGMRLLLIISGESMLVFWPRSLPSDSSHLSSSSCSPIIVSFYIFHRLFFQLPATNLIELFNNALFNPSLFMNRLAFLFKILINLVPEDAPWKLRLLI